jgi:long-chain acyl-CoA synthetase
MMLGLKSGFKNLLLVNPRDLKSVISALSKEPVHLFPGVNTLFNALLNHPRFDEMNFSELKISVGGGMAVSASVATRWRQRTQSVLLEGYGLSETSPVVAATPRTLSTFTGSVGLPMPGTQIELREGEIVVKGPQVMQGYWNAPEETRAAFTADGFFKTGDIGAWDCDGYLHIVDRKKDMILVSGFNVYPNEIEQVVCDHPDVSECAAVGVPDAVTGEAVRIFVVKKSTHLTAEDLMAHCSAYLTNYKRPQSIHFIESLPTTAVGKILRRDLRALVTELSTGK